VHQQAGAGVDFEIAPWPCMGLEMSLQDHVHAGDVQANDLGGQHGV
jgi:hypothetical protein